MGKEQLSNETHNSELQNGKPATHFSYDTVGYANAVKWLKDIGKWDYVSTHGQSTDGWSIINAANALWNQEAKS